MSNAYIIATVLVAFIGGYELARKIIDRSGAVHWRLLEQIYDNPRILSIDFAKSSSNHVIVTVRMTDRSQHCFTAASLDIAIAQIYGRINR